MSKLIKIIGSIVFSVAMYTVPICTACAFIKDWDGFLKLILLLVSAGQVSALVACVYLEFYDD